jgi:hypothetical protein
MQRAASVPRKKMILNQTHRLLPVRQSSRERATSSEGNAHVGRRDVLGNPVVGRICAVADQDHSHVRATRRPDRSGAVGDNENVEPKACGYAVDLLSDRACITVDVDFS